MFKKTTICALLFSFKVVFASGIPMSGWYIGLNGGYIWAKNQACSYNSSPYCFFDYKSAPRGTMLSTPIGYNFLHGKNILLSGEVGFQFPFNVRDVTTSKISTNFTNKVQPKFGIYTGPKLGYLTDDKKNLFSLLTGLQTMIVDSTFSTPAFNLSQSQKSWRWGWVIGLNYERSITDNISLRLGVNHVETARKNEDFSNAFGCVGIACMEAQRYKQTSTSIGVIYYG